MIQAQPLYCYRLEKRHYNLQIMRRNSFIISLILLSVSGLGAFAQTGRQAAAQKYIDLKLKEEPFRSGLTGVLAVTFRGDTLAEHNSRQKLIPASTAKLITTGLAINGLGADYRFTTKLGYSGRISDDGTLHGDLYIIGGGDPTIASGDKIAPSRDSLFAEWGRMLKRAGIRKINGAVIGDGRLYDGPIENPSWSYDDLGTFYGTGGNALCFHRNIQKINVSPSEEGKVNVAVAYPVTPWMELYSTANVAPAGSGDNLYLINTDLFPVAEMRGSLASDKGSKTEECSNKYGALTCAWYFAEALERGGVNVARVGDIVSFGNIRIAPSWGHLEKTGLNTLRKAPAQKGITIIGESKSPSVKEIARITNKRSDNFYAETLIRELSRVRTGSACYDSCKVVLLRELDSLGISTEVGIRMVDGSGLARHNYIAPDFFCRYLKAMAASEAGKTFISVINYAGNEGMTSRLKGQTDALRHRVHMKSGSMNGVVCYSGYILPPSGKLEDTVIFSIMTNNIPTQTSVVTRFIDRLIVLLAE